MHGTTNTMLTSESPLVVMSVTTAVADLLLIVETGSGFQGIRRHVNTLACMCSADKSWLAVSWDIESLHKLFAQAAEVHVET